MLFLVLLLVLAALGLLVTALITANSLWAWVSIGLSVLAGLLLVVDYFRRRALRKRAERADETAVETAIAEAEPVEDEPAETESAEAEALAEDASEEGEPAEEPAEESEEEADGEPPAEKSAPADVELVAKLDVEVVVVDEYPRYHLDDCAWLDDRETIPIVVKEARDLGFTPCALCTPDAKLAAAERAD